MGLDDRKNRVLQALIEDYVATAEPVGSRTLARKYQLGVSPATIRNEMSDLEDLGFLEQPHTSAGRIPSDRGYRYYVDCLMQKRTVTANEEDLIRRTFQRKAAEIETLIRETARLLSDATKLTAVVTGPQNNQAQVRELRLVPLGGDKAILIYVTNSGFVENQVLELPVEITMLELQRVSDLLNEQLRGQPVQALSRTAIRALQNELQRYGALLEQALTFMGERLEESGRQRIILGGTTNILAQPEFQDVDKVRRLLGLLEHEESVANLLAGKGEARGPMISIGEEIQVQEMMDCSIVSTTYRVGDQAIGRMGVIGPKRMEYGRVVGILDSITKHLAVLPDRK
ncbi:MAG TPA: heat-inducible transcriptional repressor HrcA [Symbiobacteriaceae bacterium]|nr:heat-inducible transcriptional repressor HrcA [Symbiobacteriaceae bacterium]